MEKYSKHYWKIEKYKQNFETMLNCLEKEKDFKTKADMAVYALNYFVYHNTGYFTSSVLENFFVQYAKKIKVDLKDIKYEKNSILHVMTEGYTRGGHTRVVERWIDKAPNWQKHSVVLTRPSACKLADLKNNAEKKNGQYIPFDNSLSLEERAIKLRKLGMQYEYIILHTHMEDPIAVMAFGTEDFTRPVFFYNHASHMPWIGKSIADVVLDIERNDPVTKNLRGISNTYFVGVPSNEILIQNFDKNEVRKELNLPLDKKIIVTSGGEVRYRTIAGRNFVEFLNDIMDDDTCCYVIGVNPDNPKWQKAIEKSGKNIRLLGFIDFNKGFLNYLKAADLYLDSYPLGGGTASIDAISSETPILSLETVYPQFDYLTQTSAYCHSEEEFIEKAKRVLNDSTYAKSIYEEVKNSLIKEQSNKAWNSRIEKLFNSAPKSHSVKDLTGAKDYSKPCDLSVLCNSIHIKGFIDTNDINLISEKDFINIVKHGVCYKKQGIPFVFQILTYRKLNNQKVKVIKLFNIKIAKWKKSSRKEKSCPSK